MTADSDFIPWSPDPEPVPPGYTPQNVARLVEAARASLDVLAQHPTRMYAVEHSELDAALAPFTDPPTSHPPRSARGAADLAVTE